jgi:hypothetical protein
MVVSPLPCTPVDELRFITTCNLFAHSGQGALFACHFPREFTLCCQPHILQIAFL